MFTLRHRRRVFWLILLPGILTACLHDQGTNRVVTSRLQRQDFLDQVTVSGTLESIRTISFACPMIFEDLKIIHLIPEGTMVVPGDTLCIMEASELMNNYIQAQLQVENSEADYEKTKADLDLQYLVLESQVRNIEASTQITQLDSVQMQFTSPSNREIIRLELQKAEIQKDITLKKLEFLQKINEAELQKMKLKIRREQINVDQIESKLDQLILISSVSGIVIYERNWGSGEKVREGDAVWYPMPVVKVPDLSSMQVKLEVNEADYKRLAVDQEVTVTVDAFPEIVLGGRIKYKAPVGKPVKRDSDVKFFEITASLDSTTFSIQPGLGVTCAVMVKSISDTVVVPIISVFDEDSTKVVYVEGESSFIRKEVKLSEYNLKEAVVREGLAGNEVIALMKPPAALIQ